MKNEQMLRLFMEDRKEMNDYLNHLTAQWEKTVKKYPRTRYKVTTYTCKKSHQEYVIVHLHMGDSPNKGICRKEFAIVKDGNKTYYVTSVFDFTAISMYSAHFFKRYKERMHKEELLPLKVIGDYLHSTMSLSPIYEENGKLVLANLVGVELCEEKENIIWHNTFVSYAMLKASQREAYNKIEEHLKQISQYFGNSKYCGTFRFIRGLKDLRYKLGNSEIEEAKEIYRTYFEDRQ